MIHLADLPLEDLAVGLFPHGARLTVWKDENTASSPEFVSEEDVIKIVREYRKPGVISAVESEIHTDLEGIVWSSLRITKTHIYYGPRLDFASGDIPKKPFLVKLPKWLVPKTMYDAVDLSESLLSSFSIYIHRHKNTLTVTRYGHGGVSEEIELRAII